MYFDNNKLLEILNKSTDYISHTKAQYMNLHSYFVCIDITQREYAEMLKVRDSDDNYKIIQQALDVIERAKDIIISNILTTQVLNPYAKNGNVAMQYLKIISREFRDDEPQQERLNIVIKAGAGPISLKNKKEDK